MHTRRLPTLRWFIRTITRAAIVGSSWLASSGIGCVSFVCDCTRPGRLRFCKSFTNYASRIPYRERKSCAASPKRLSGQRYSLLYAIAKSRPLDIIGLTYGYTSWYRSFPNIAWVYCRIRPRNVTKLASSGVPVWNCLGFGQGHNKQDTWGMPKRFSEETGLSRGNHLNHSAGKAMRSPLLESMLFEYNRPTLQQEKAILTVCYNGAANTRYIRNLAESPIAFRHVACLN